MFAQHKIREIVFQLLYSFTIGTANEEEMIPLLMKELSVTRKAVATATQEVRAIQGHLDKIDTLLAKTSQAYAFERIQTVELTVLRLGIYELLHRPEIPPKVVLSEAVRLATKFGSPEAGTFVNAVLDAIYKDSQGELAERKAIEDSYKKLAESESLAQEAALQQKQELEDEDLS
jgi:N utilization substance protein B